VKNLKILDKSVFDIIKGEVWRQSYGLNLIASENFASENVLYTSGSIFTNKYAEGYPFKRYYSGCTFYDEIETLAINRAKALFSAEHANVQPHSGSNANLSVYQAILKPGDTILSMHLDHGGHLTHGASVSNIGQVYNIISYGVKKDCETLDYEKVHELALKYRPKIIIAGASAYPRVIDFSRFADAAKAGQSLLMVDMSHISGLVASGHHPSPFPYADIVTTTTHKTLRGPRGGLILCKSKYKNIIDKSVFPGLQGGPLMNMVLAKSICFKEAMQYSFYKYQRNIIENARNLSICLKTNGFDLVSGGTDNHLMLVKLDKLKLNGDESQRKLESINVFVNKNKIPFDKENALMTSGLRIGTAAITSLGMQRCDMKTIADIITKCLHNKESTTALKKQVTHLAKKYIHVSLKK
jgi:glycine hydroxymethyltransferase